MFDEIFVDMPLPGNTPSTRHFQTKDLECLLLKFTITREGRLLENGKPYDFFGTITFYTRENDVWFEYKAKVNDGYVENIYVGENLGGIS